MKIRMRKTGDFCWINVLTPQPARAREFFAELLRWSYTEMPGVGHTVSVGGRDIGGFFDLAAPGTPMGTPPGVGVVLKVDCTETTRRRVDALGGASSPTFELMGQGRTAVCLDPKGAEFDVWEHRNPQPAPLDGSVHGTPSWFELTTSDCDRAAAFYSELFGWTPQVRPVPGAQYAVFKHGEVCVAGLLNLRPHMALQRPHWATFFTVEDVEHTALEALRLGGTLSVPILELPGVGRFCGITSPQGLTFYVISYAPGAVCAEPEPAG